MSSFVKEGHSVTYDETYDHVFQTVQYPVPYFVGRYVYFIQHPCV